MTRRRPLWILLLLLPLGATLYLFVPTREDLARRIRPIREHQKQIEQTLADCSDLLHELDQRKSTVRKKQELSELRRRAIEMAKSADRFLEDDSIDREVARKGLEDLEPEYYALCRDCEDLRARLRELKRCHGEIEVEISRLGRNQVALMNARKSSGDLSFNQRVEELIDEGRKFRAMAEQGLSRLAFSIVEGRPIVESALTEMRELNDRMDQLLRSKESAPQSSSDQDASSR